MVTTVARDGYAGTSVTGLTATAHISRATFYRHFEDLRGCFECVIDDGYLQTAAVMRGAFADADCWRDGVRAAFACLLGYFDEDPDLARVLLVEVVAAGAWAIERREHHIAKLAAVVGNACTPLREAAMPHPMAVQAARAAAIGLMQSHVVSRSEQPLLSLLGPLVGAVGAVVLDQREVRDEVEKADAIATRLIASRETRIRSNVLALVRIPALLLDPRAMRARAALLYVQKSPHASNREIAEAAGIAGRAQASALLGRLARLGLIEKPSTRPGDACSWAPTPYGVAVAEALRAAV